MINPVWPAELPQDVMVEGYDEAFSDTVLRTRNEAGPPKKRRRFTAATTPLRVNVWLTRPQMATLETFYETTLAGGALNFDWVHPRTQTAATLGFTAPPSARPDGKGAKRWIARLDLEIFP